MKHIWAFSLFLAGAAFMPLANAQQNPAAVPDAPVPNAPPMTASEATVLPVSDGRTASSSGEQTVAALPSGAQVAVDAAATPIEREINEQLAYLKPGINVNEMPSLFFSVWEHDLVIDARRGLTTRIPGTEDGLAAGTGPRDISLGGIVYVSSNEWTIWLNSIRVSPNAIPDEVLDLKVHKEYIELEWFDEATNQIYPIRLRPHQRFNLDTRIFLPG